jgi:hypothetical protein
MSTLSGGEKLGFELAEVFLVSFHCVLHDTFISRLWSATFQPTLIFLAERSGGLPTAITQLAAAQATVPWAPCVFGTERAADSLAVLRTLDLYAKDPSKVKSEDRPGWFRLELPAGAEAKPSLDQRHLTTQNSRAMDFSWYDHSVVAVVEDALAHPHVGAPFISDSPIHEPQGWWSARPIAITNVDAGTLIFRRQGGDDFLEARIAAKRIPEG